MYALTLEAEWAPRPGYQPTPAELRSRKARMASAAYRHPKLVPGERPDPSPGPHEVLIAVQTVGVCGSDTHCYETDDEGYVIFSGPARFPEVLGHEYAGEIVAVGAEVRHLRPGMLVAAEGMLYCGVCEACRKGLFNQCPSLDMVGFSSPGAYADYIVAHEKHCWSVDGVAEHLGDRRAALERAALIEPTGCSYNGMFVVAGGLKPGSHVAVWGCGPIGLAAIALARVAGAATVAAFDVSPARVEVARRLGADVALDLRDGADAAEAVRELTRGWGADMVVEAAGAAVHTMPAIERALAPAGTVVYLGRTGERAPVMLDELVSGASRIVGARGHAGGGVFPNIIRLMERGLLDLSPMITTRMGLHEADAAVRRSATREDAKIMLRAW